MTWLKTLLLLTFLACISFLAEARTSIELDHLSLEERADLLKHFPILQDPLVESSDLTAEEYDRILKYLMGHGNFRKLSFTRKDGRVRLETVRLKIIRNLIIDGENRLPESDILRSVQVKKQDYFDPEILDDISIRVKTLYQEHGFPESQIQVSTINESDSELDIHLQIAEHLPTKIIEIRFETSNERLSKKLKGLTKSITNEIDTAEVRAEIYKRATDYLREFHFIRSEVLGPEVIDNGDHRVTLSYKVEHGETYLVKYTGNFEAPTTSLDSALDLKNFFSPNPMPGTELVGRLKEFYYRRGFARVEIETEEKIEKDLDGENRLILFKVVEGPRVKIKEVEFTGTLSRVSGYYADFLKKHSGETVENGLFHRADLELGLKNLVVELQNQGFLKARIITSRFLANQKKDEMSIVINLDEGPLTRLSRIEFTGQAEQSTQDLLKLMELREGDALQLLKLEEGLTKVENKFRNSGYLEMQIINKKEGLVVYSQNQTQAQINIRIQTGPKVHVASIFIDGNSLTKDYVIRKEIEFTEGDVLTPSKIEESRKRLQKLNLFSSVEIRTLEEYTQIADRTVVIHLVERNPGLFNFGFGVTNERELTLRGFTGIAYRNIQGTARAVSTRADVNYNIADVKFPELKLSVGYLEPYLFDTRIKGRVNVSRYTQVISYDTKNREATDTLQTDYLVEENITSNLLLTYDIWNLSAFRDFRIDRSSPVPDKIQNIGTTGPAIELDYRDHPFNPQHGTLSRLQLEYSSPALGSSPTIEFLRTTGSFTHYYGFDGMVWANSVRGGDLINRNHGNNGGVPYTKKGFYLGGLTTIRGFDASTQDRLPNDIDLHGPDYVMSTRNQFYLVKSELRFPIVGNIAGAVFYDGGQVAIEGLQLPYSYRDAVGIGIKYITPFGPFNLEMAWKIKHYPDRGESPFRVHIYIGSF